MSKGRLFRTMAVVALAVVAAFTLIGCGDDNESALLPITNTSTAMSQSEATSFVTQLFNGVGNSNAMKPQQQQKILEATSTASGTYTCTSGGQITVSGTFTTPDGGTGTATMDVTETISDWKCISGYTVNGTIAVDGSFNISNTGISSFSMTMIGSVSTQSASCPINIAITSSNGTNFTIAGAACGQTISSSI